MVIYRVSAGCKIVKGVRKIMYQSRRHLSQMHTINELHAFFAREKAAAFWREKILSQ